MPDTPPLMSLQELVDAELPTQRVLVQDMLLTGGFSLFAGQPKAGKSTFARNLLMAVARGDEFLGRQCSANTCLYYALEEHIRTLQDHFRQLGAATEPVYLRIGPIEKGLIRSVLLDDIEAVEPKLIVIDPLFDAIAADDSNNYALVNRELKRIADVARTTDTHVMVVHHANKSDRQGGLGILGSQALRAATDINLFLSVADNGVTRWFHSEQRYGRPMDRTALDWDEDRGTIVTQGSPLERIEKDILDVIMQRPDGVPTEYIKSAVYGNNSTKVRALQALRIRGDLIQVKQGRAVLWQLNGREM